MIIHSCFNFNGGSVNPPWLLGMNEEVHPMRTRGVWDLLIDNEVPVADLLVWAIQGCAGIFSGTIFLFRHRIWRAGIVTDDGIHVVASLFGGKKKSDDMYCWTDVGSTSDWQEGDLSIIYVFILFFQLSMIKYRIDMGIKTCSDSKDQ